MLNIFFFRWIPNLFNVLSFRPLEPMTAIYANSLFQQIIVLNVANFHRDLPELMHVLLWLMTFKDNAFYKKYNNLPQLKEMEKSPLFPWNVRVFRKNGPKGSSFVVVVVIHSEVIRASLCFDFCFLFRSPLSHSCPQSSFFHKSQNHCRQCKLPHHPLSPCPPRDPSPAARQVCRHCHRCDFGPPSKLF